MPSSMCFEEEKSLLMVQSFVSVMDNLVEPPYYNIANDAVMDWCGRSICGRTSIVKFINTHVPNCQHNVEEVVRIPHISHRLLKQTKKNVIRRSTVQEERREENDNGQRTPDNPICPNLDELCRAPKVKKRHWTVNSADLEFVEINGSISYEHTSDGTTYRMNKRGLKKIVLGYSDEIHFIEYGGVMPSCRINLFQQFRNVV